MHNLMAVASRRKAGLAASMVLVGGMAGGVLLMSGTAYASTAVNTSTSINLPISQTHHFNGSTTLGVSVTVSPATGTAAPTGTVTVSAGSESCNITLAEIGATANSGGTCYLGGIAAGLYTVKASYAGVANAFNPSPLASAGLTVGSGPAFTADSPSLSANNGQSYSYNFNASGDPAPAFSLASGSPGWLSIDTSNGVVSGNVPNGISSFTYSVDAANSIGNVTAGPFTVKVSHGFPGGGNGRLSTSLHCSSPVHSGSQGTCTLDVTNTGGRTDQSVTGQINLPSGLRADFCGHGWGWGWGHWNNCSISNNSASENLGTLRPGQSRALTVTFTAQSTRWFWGWGHQFREWVHVTGSASSGSGYYWAPGWLGGYNTSTSSTWVQILPPHFWI